MLFMLGMKTTKQKSSIIIELKLKSFDEETETSFSDWWSQRLTLKKTNLILNVKNNK